MRVLALPLALVGTLSAALPAAATDKVPLAARLDALVASYPGYIEGVEGNELVLTGGKRHVIDDGKPRTHAEMLESGDIEDMLSQVYPLGACVSQEPPANDFEPGRVRNETFFKGLYGTSAAEVRRHLTSVEWFGEKLPVMRLQGVDAALARVRADLAKLDPGLNRYLTPSAGTFNWRPIAGTGQLSAHSFGIAIDINTAFTDYWRWAGKRPAVAIAYKNRIPLEIVHVFERHGFIWGGKWYHYDTMHFEYRPELIRIGELAERAGC
ncbi:MAG TPA: M15 family metallopeptidase [Hyphomicrobiaceae bacterium]|nr:M15 family metallopeptidase [Hyphomicrobiaceae bacterium]